MARYFYCDMSQFWRKGSTFFLAFSWFLGLVFGILAFLLAGNSLVSLMRSSITGSVSIVSLLCVSILPFLLSAFAVFISEPVLLLLISFGKAFLFSYASLGVMLSYGSAGWLIRVLLMFSDCVVVPVLYCFWLRYISGDRKLGVLNLCGFFSLLLLIGSMDYCIVSPLLARLING